MLVFSDLKKGQKVYKITDAEVIPHKVIKFGYSQFRQQFYIELVNMVTHQPIIISPQNNNFYKKESKELIWKKKELRNAKKNYKQ